MWNLGGAVDACCCRLGDERIQFVGRLRELVLYFGPTAPPGKETQWIKTIPGKGWFVYFRVYGPEQAAFDGSWKPGDFEEVK